MITIVMPFRRTKNLPFIEKALKGKCDLIVLTDDPSLRLPEWITMRYFDLPKRDGACQPNRLFNEFLATTKLEDEGQYMILCDDDSVEEGFFDKIPNENVVIVSMQRTDRVSDYVVWDDWDKRKGHLERGVDVLKACKENLKIARIGGEQMIVKGKILRNFRYGLSWTGDWDMIQKITEEYQPVFVPDAKILFNYFEDGRWSSFRRKPLVLFIGDYYCAANPRMGKSEWEGGLAHSLDSTGLADVITFHFDRYFFETGKKGDEALLKAIADFKPDYIVIVIYKALDKEPTTISLSTLSAISVPIISIWGDLEAEEQQVLAKSLEPFMWKVVSTANKAIAERFGYTYLHVPKDSRIFNDSKKERDIDIVFSGSYGYGREERQKYMLCLLNNGVKLVHGGSEGGDHFTTEEYADRYKRAKLALSFSQARGMNVVNARPFEAMSCGAMLLEQESLELAKLYTPFVDYVPWTDEVDLLNKVRYYLEHDDERTLIASNGQKKTESLYSAKTFWSKVLECKC